ncbi:type VI secretion system protein TssA [uncultured Paraglaciecola sp.]|mgnify:CR=1 FL=1|uniref:type VI secretion system protein TssA n=1 Tax=uncultured Paraglaciecola sp. TaxID=1765024 RepID=UPI0030DC9B7E|tara:strand:- start:450523 stop:451629 length:1107 start_codon:yes stop_codon:yes gene_type:complete
MDYDQDIISDIPGDSVCGINLEDDSGFQNFFFESQGTPERFDGQSTIPAEPPEWRTVKKQAIEYLAKTRDLKLISVLAQAVLNTEGLYKFEQCLNGLSHQVKEHWQELFPALDEDDGDPLERISALGHLSDKDFVINVIRQLPIAHSKVLGNVTLQKIDRAVSPGGSKNEGDLELPQIIGIFKESDTEQNTATYTVVNQCITHLNEINKAFIEQAGNEYNVNFDAIVNVLTDLSNSLKKYGDLRLEVVTQTDEGADASESEQQNANSATTNTATATSFNFATDMKLASRNDVERCFGLILSYYQECEPSSPVPILIGRAKKLVNSDFLDIVKDIFPDALEQVQKLGGISDSEPDVNTDESSSSSGSSW